MNGAEVELLLDESIDAFNTAAEIYEQANVEYIELRRRYEAAVAQLQQSIEIDRNRVSRRSNVVAERSTAARIKLRLEEARVRVRDTYNQMVRLEREMFRLISIYEQAETSAANNANPASADVAVNSDGQDNVGSIADRFASALHLGESHVKQQGGKRMNGGTARKKRGSRIVQKRARLTRRRR
jgi:tetratricopeptide (TPR) repeat protein